MSNVVDNRVVEMQFDNRQFERNVATSMSTLDKLKQKLNLSKSAQSLDGLEKAARKVNFSGLSSGVEAVQAKFSALQVAGVTALANITNSAVNAGKNIASALTIEPVTSGFHEYETQIGAIQTILANTQSKGSTLDDVNRALDELNKYADQTIYNFTEMTRNIGTFTAAGVGLDKSVSSIKGIANLAAVSGSTSQQASTAMYQLSQALAAGRVSLMDWNSVVNAGMGGEIFQTALKRTATQMGKDVDGLIEKYGSFRESLTEGEWLTTDVLTETLTQLSGAYTEADLIAQGYSESQAKEITELAKTAVSAATDVKTFTQLFDTLKEAAQSGWTQSWELLIGDFEQSKELLTGISNVVGDFINKSAESRNNLLEGALTSNWDKMIDKINEAGVNTDTFNEKVKSVAEDQGVDINAIIEKYGSLEDAFRSGAVSSDILKEAVKSLDSGLAGLADTGKLFKFGDGLDEASDEVKKLQESLEEAGFSLEKFGVDGKFGQETQAAVKAFQEANGLMADGIVGPDTIDALNKATSSTEDLSGSVNGLIDDITELGGRELIIDSFKNLFQAIVTPIKAIKSAWDETFPPMTSDQLYGIIEAVNSFSKKLVMSEASAEKLSRTFKGLFALIDILNTVVGGGFNMAFKGVSKLLEAFDTDLLSVTANLGDSLVAFRDFLFDNGLINTGFELTAKGIAFVADALFDLGAAIASLPSVQAFFESLQNIDLSEIGQNAIAGLENGLVEGISSVPGILIQIGQSILSAIKGVLGIHSPSTEMHDVGTNAIEGLCNGLEEGISKVGDVLSEIGSDILEFGKGLDWGAIFAGGASIGILLIVKKLAGAFEALVSPVKGAGSVLEGTGSILQSTSNVIDKSVGKIPKILGNVAKVVKSFSKVLSAYAFSMRADAIKDIAVSVGILAGAVVALTLVDQGKLSEAVNTVVLLAGMLAALSIAINSMSDSSVTIGKSGAKINGIKPSLVGIGAALLMMAATVKIIGSMDPDSATRGLIALSGMMAAMFVFVLACDQIVSGDSAKSISKIGGMMLKLSVALLLMIAATKLISGLSADEIKKGTAFAAAFSAFVLALSWASSKAGKEADKIGGMVLKLSVAMLLLVGVIKLIAGMSWGELGKGAVGMVGFVAFVAAIAKATQIGKDKTIAKLGGTLLAISAAMLIMSGVIKLIAGMSWGELGKGAVGIIGLGAIMIALITVVKKFGPEAPKLAGTLLAMSAAIGILAGVAVLLGMVSTEGLAKGVIAVGILGTVMALMIAATKNASKCTANLIVLTVAVGVMAAAVAGLSLIDPSRLAGATLAMTMLMGMFSLMAVASSVVNKSYGTLIVMTVVVGVLALVLAAISKLPVESTLSNATALSELMLALSAMTAILAGVGMVGGVAAAASGALALDAVILIVGGLMVGLGALMTYVPQAEAFLDKGLPVLEKIGYAIGSFFGNIVGGFASGATSGLPEIGTNLSNFMENASGFFEATKGLDTSSISVIPELLTALAAVVGTEIVDTVFEFFTGQSAFDKFGEDLISFGKAMSDFSKTISGDNAIDAEAITAVTNAGEMLAALQDAIPESGGWLQKFTGEHDWNDFSDGISAFAEAMKGASDKLGEDGINAEAFDSIVAVGHKMAELQSSLENTEGAIQWFKGHKDLGDFGTGIKTYAEALKGASDACAKGDSINTETFDSIAAIGHKMADLQSTLESTGGVIDFFTGKKDLGNFGANIKDYAQGLKDATKALGKDNIDPEDFTNAITVGEKMNELQSSLPEDTEGFFSTDMNLSSFATNIQNFATGLTQFAGQVQGLDTDEINTVIASARQMVELIKQLTGDDSISSAVDVSGMKTIGTGLSDFYAQVSEIDSGKVASSISDATALKGLIVSLADFDSSGVASFNVEALGTKLSEYAGSVASVDSGQIANSVSAIQQLISVINSMKGIDASGVSQFTSALSTLGSANLSGVADAFKGSASQMSSVGADMMNSLTSGLSQNSSAASSAATSAVNGMLQSMTGRSGSFMTAGTSMMTNLINGIMSQSGAVANAAALCMSAAISQINGWYGSFSASGTYVASGFVNGIGSQINAAANAAASMAAAASAAARANLRIASPSKVFYQIGSFVGQGFVNALHNSERNSYKAGESMADSARSGLSAAVSKIGRVIDGVADLQPTIRPVLDLSNVQSGVGTLNGMLGSGNSMSIMANLSAINTSMNRRRQNGSNADVVSAINKLGKSIGNMPRNTTTINGITYDNGSAINEAVETLVRAAKVERRK